MKTPVKFFIASFFALVSLTSIYAQTISANGTLTFANGTTAIRNSAYRYDQTIKYVEFPSTLKTIVSRAFQYCVYIDDDLVLPQGVTTIGKEAFYNCVNIHKITVPESVTSIDENAFSKNTSLVVKQNSYAHKWAMANGYDYQFTASGYPKALQKCIKTFT